MSNNQVSANGPVQMRFAPIPLLSGDAVTGTDGKVDAVAEVAVVVRLANGDAIEIPLYFEFGGWWASVPTVGL